MYSRRASSTSSCSLWPGTRLKAILTSTARAGRPRGQGAVPGNRWGLLSQMEAPASAMALPSPRPQKSPAWAKDGSVFSACNPGGILSSPVSGQQTTRESPPWPCAGHCKTASLRQGIWRCSPSCHASPSGAPGIFLASGECLLAVSKKI